MNPIRLKANIYILIFIIICLLGIFLLYNNMPDKPMDCSTSYLSDNKFKNILKYCNPHSEIRGKEGEIPQQPDSQYKIISVHAFIRHGDRYHLHSYKNGQRPKISCNLQDIPKKDQIENFISYMFYLKSQFRKHGDTYHDRKVYPQSTHCTSGQLTPLGVMQHASIGRHFQKAYLSSDQSLFDPSSFNSKILVRCTNKTRTYQSAVALLQGFSPHFSLSKIKLEHSTDNSLCYHGNHNSNDLSNGHSNCNCPWLRGHESDMSVSFKERDLHTLPAYQKVFKHMKEVFYEGVQGNTKEGEGDEKVPTLTNQMDMSMIHGCHGLALPMSKDKRCLEPWSVLEVDALLRKNARRNTLEYSYRQQSIVKMLPVLREMLARWYRQTQDNVGTFQKQSDSSDTFILYSAHDTTLDPLLSVLGIGKGEWPPYASRIVFELIQSDTNEGREYFIRVLFNGEVVTNEIQFCDVVNASVGICRLTQFHEFFTNGYTKFTNENKRSKICTSKHV